MTAPTHPNRCLNGWRCTAARYSGAAAAPPDITHTLVDAHAAIVHLKAALRTQRVAVDGCIRRHRAAARCRAGGSAAAGAAPGGQLSQPLWHAGAALPGGAGQPGIARPCLAERARRGRTADRARAFALSLNQLGTADPVEVAARALLARGLPGAGRTIRPDAAGSRAAGGGGRRRGRADTQRWRGAAAGAGAA